MKIGELAKLTGVSKDSIRFYVENGLLFPDRQGPQMDFSDREQEDLFYIKRLRKARFSIKEIKFLQSLKHTSNMLEPDILEEYCDMLNQKQASLEEEIEELCEAKKLLMQEKINLQSTRNNAIHQLGVPLRALKYIVCPNCGAQMEMENARIAKGGYILEGDMHCVCGHQISVEDGILMTGNRYTKNWDHPDYRHGGIVQNVGDNFYNCFRKCYDFIMSNIEGDFLEGKVVMEAQVNGYFFLYKHFNRLPTDCLYIIVDKFPETLRTYKKLLEQLNLPLEILFIADNSVNYPLRERCVDLLISFFGDNEYLLYHHGFFIQDAGRFMKNENLVLGATMSFRQKSKSRELMPMKYPESSPKTHNINELKKAYETQSYDFICQEVGTMTKTCNEYAYECHQDGEPLDMYYFKAERK